MEMEATVKKEKKKKVSSQRGSGNISVGSGVLDSGDNGMFDKGFSRYRVHVFAVRGSVVSDLELFNQVTSISKLATRI